MAENLDSYNAALARSIHSAIQRSTPLNKNYQDRIKRFTKFVDSHPRRDEFLLPPNKYCSKQSIETFLLENERGRKCNRSTAEKTILAINKLVILEENAELGPDIRTNGVTNMAVSAYLNWIENEDLERKKARLSDPLEDNPIKFATPYDLSKVSTTRLQERGTNWADVAVVWAVASRTGLRFENVSKLSLDKLYLAENLMPHGWYVPPDGKVWGEQNNQRKTDTRLLTFLIPPVDQIKKNSKHQELQTEVVGAYRHKRVSDCMVGTLAFVLLERLEKTNISFYDREHVPNGSTYWADLNFFDFGYEGCRKGFLSAMQAAGVTERNKVTHLRKDISFCLTAMGFTGEEVKFMTKHKMDIFLKDYCCPINIRVCRALAGFNPLDESEKYCVPRTKIEMPGGMTVEQVTSLLFPSIHRWREELQSSMGDKVRSQSAGHFLYKILPFFAEVCVQDGIYWVKEFPQNTATMLLLQRLENKTGNLHYSVFAQRGRAEVQKVQMEEELKAATLEDKLDRLTKNVSALQNYWEQQFTSWRNREQLQPGPPFVAPSPAPVVVAEESLTQQYSYCYQHQQQHQQQRQLLKDTSTPNLRVLREFDCPLKPTILTLNTYGSLTKLVSLSTAHFHHTIQENMPADRWNDPTRDRMNWSKLKLLYRRIDDCRGRRPDDSPKTRIEMAEILDREEKRDMSLETYWKWLRSRREYEPRKKRRRVSKT